MGESANLTLRFDGGSPRVVPNIPNIPGLRFQEGGVSQGYSSFNGQATVYIAQSYLVTPSAPGEYTIPAMQTDIDGQALQSQPLRLSVVKASEGEQMAFFKIALPKKEAYVGEVIPVEFQVYLRDSMNGEGILRQFEAYNGSPLKGEGFSFLKTARGTRRQMQVGSFNYNVATLLCAVSPAKAGTLTLSAIEVGLTLQIPTGNQGGPFGIFQNFEQRPITLSAEPQTLTVLAVPRTNVPPTFTGAVGAYTIKVSAAPTNVAVGDPITVKVQISGRGAFDSFTLPDQPGWRDFKTYPPAAKFEPRDALGMDGTKTFDQGVVPQNADIKVLPPFSFSFFNPNKKAYETVTGPSLALDVQPGGSAAAPSVAAGSQRPADNPPPSKDIVHIKPRPGALAQFSAPLITRPWFLGLQVVPILLWIAALLWRRHHESLASNPRLRRQRQVAALVRDGLAELRTLAAENKSEAFFALFVRLLQEQLGERLDQPASAITEAVIDDRLRPRNVPEPLLTSLHELFQLCNLVRYAPIKTSQELAAIIPKLESALMSLQQLKL